MKLVLPFTYMDQWHYNRYKDQFLAYSRHFEKVTIPVQFGIYPKNDIDNVEIILWRILDQQNINRTGYKIKYFFKKITLYHWYQRLQQNKKMLEYFLEKGIEGDILLSYSGTGLIQNFHCDLGDALKIPKFYRMRGNGVEHRKLSASLPNRIISDYFHFKSLKRYDGFIPITFEFYKDLRNWGIDKSKISNPIGIGVDIDLFKRIEYPDELTIGFFGRISEEKNINFLKKIMKKTPNVNYIVLGKNRLKIKFPKNAQYLGYVQKHNMPKYYNKINALINPSKLEGIPNILLEAYSTKTPVLGSPITFSYLPVFGYKIVIDNIDRWVKIINHLDLLELKQIGYLARNYVENISWLKFGKNMANAMMKDE